MLKKLICVECPNGCLLSVEIEDKKIVSVGGNKCDKGVTYSQSEIEKPLRILTSSVLAKGLQLKMISVRTDLPIPKDKLIEAMREIKEINVCKPVSIGDVVVENFLGLKVNLIATRESIKE